MAGRIIDFRKNQVYMDHWLRFHPYKKPSVSDNFYLKICKEVHDIMVSGEHSNITKYINDEELSFFACFMVCYFEDVISGVRIWQSFTNEHLKLYGKYLPFYQLSEYYPEEINQEDVFFLIWYYISCFFSGEKIFLPVSENIIDLGLKVYNVFDREYEYAPENSRLIDFFNIPQKENDFYRIRFKMEWLTLDSYLFHFNGLWRDQEIDDLIEAKENEEYYQENMEVFSYEITDSYVNNKATPLLAYFGKDWLSKVIGESHSLYKDICKLESKKTGYFLFEKEDSDCLHFKHIATDTHIPVTKKSLERHFEFKEGETILLISVIKWQEEWWFSGTYSILPYNADLILDEKNSISSRALFSGPDKDKEEIIQKQLDAFLKVNNGRPIAFLRNKNELDLLLENFNKGYEESLHLSKKEKKEASERAKSKGFLGDKNKPKDYLGDIENDPLIVFFNQKSGIELCFGFNDIIPDFQNYDYDPSVDPLSAINLILSDEFSSELVKFLSDNYDLPGMKFPGEGSNPILKYNLDFMMRFWKRNYYYSKPQVTLI